MCVVYINHLEADYGSFGAAGEKEPPCDPQPVKVVCGERSGWDEGCECGRHLPIVAAPL